MNRRKKLLLSVLLLGTLCTLLGACAQPPAPAPPATPSLLHLAEALADATVESAPPPDLEERFWSFAEPRPEWTKADRNLHPRLVDFKTEQQEDGIRISLDQPSFGMRIGGFKIDLDDLRFADWERVLVRARTEDRLAGLSVATNLEEQSGQELFMRFVMSADEVAPMFNDGSVQTYSLPLYPPPDGEQAAVRNFAILFGGLGDSQVDLLSVTLVPRGAAFTEEAGTLNVTRDGTTRTTLYAHTPAKLTWEMPLPPGARLDFGLTIEPGDEVTYRVRAEVEGAEPVLWEETVRQAGSWSQHGIDLGSLGDESAAGKTARLTLEAVSDRDGTPAQWGAPILSGSPDGDRPNVIFYVIDGGDADLMGLYGYERETTPFLQELAAEAVVFTRAYTNSTWTQPSTVSFMTSLQHSVLGGLRRGAHSTSVPKAATTMAEHFRNGGYQTFSLTANPNAGRLIGLDRGVDLMRDVATEHHSTASVDLQERYWHWRDAYPGGPTWVHFQTTDVHEPNEPEEPYAGRLVSDEDLQNLKTMERQIFMGAGKYFGATSMIDFYRRGIAAANLDRHDFFGIKKSLYDETMMHQDHSLENLVAELKRRGEWERTILVIASDHGHPAATYAPFGRGLLDPEPELWQGALFDAYSTRIPLIIVHPGTIEGGRRVDMPVSMIDILPTLLDLAGLPAPEVLQGRSLAPLLRGEEIEPKPVILDEFRIDSASGEMLGNLEIIDGKWGASLEIAPLAEGADPRLGRHATPAGGRWAAMHPYFPDVPNLLLYDLEQDPYATRALNEEYPELVERYRRQLLEYWEAHQALSTRFSQVDEEALDPAQLEQLRALGYIQ